MTAGHLHRDQSHTSKGFQDDPNHISMALRRPLEAGVLPLLIALPAWQKAYFQVLTFVVNAQEPNLQ